LEKRVFGEGKWKVDSEVESSCDSIAETAKWIEVLRNRNSSLCVRAFLPVLGV
jgi:hypothetical protein